MRKIIVFGVLLILLTSCASSPKLPPMSIGNFTLFSTFSYTETISKAYYDTHSKTVFALEPLNHQILFLREGKRLNAVGGLGMGSSNFKHLADISMSESGNIYALDSVAKTVKKFNSDGRLLASWELPNTVQPHKLAISTEENCYVWDKATSEIIVYKLQDSTELFRFGRFKQKRVEQLYATRDYVVAWDRETGESNIFSSLGQYLFTEAGQMVYDPYNNGISLSQEALRSKMSAAYLGIEKDVGIMTIGRETLAIVVDSHQVRLLKIDYEKLF